MQVRTINVLIEVKNRLQVTQPTILVDLVASLPGMYVICMAKPPLICAKDTTKVRPFSLFLLAWGNSLC